ncbi:DUF2442 domain-containing protein [Parafilimonas sp.]|uniref:DUF2442 domain-containing protein n=1 Tax=Parafilimonas sp. TaxID=1969739 RepID=UPI0039E6A59D
MHTSINKFDTIDSLIHEEGLRIKAIEFHPEQDLMFIILNTKAVLHQKLSSYKSLFNADPKSLIKYELISDGTGAHWPLLDEDLSLKGFLKDELKQIVRNKQTSV